MSPILFGGPMGPVHPVWGYVLVPFNISYIFSMLDAMVVGALLLSMLLGVVL